MNPRLPHAHPRPTRRMPTGPWLRLLVLGAMLAPSACSSDEGSPACPCAGDICPPDTCGEGAAQDTSNTGMFTRVAALSDGRLVTVSRDAARRAVAVIVFDPQGTIVARHTLTGPGRGDSNAHPDDGGDGGWWPSVAVTTTDRIHVAWHEAERGVLLHTEGAADTGFATPTVVDGAGPEILGTHTDMAIDAGGAIHIVYRSETRRSLKYARRADGGAWTTEDIPVCAGEATCPISSAEDYGRYASLAVAIEAGGRPTPRVAFYDGFRGDLKLATRSAVDGVDGWRVTTLDGRNTTDDADSGHVGRFVSLAVTPLRNLAAAYFDDSAGALRHLNPGAAPRVLDDGEYATDDGRTLRRYVGQFARLRVDADGVHHILYVDATTIAWKYLRIEGETVGDGVVLDALRPGGWLDFVTTPDGIVGAYGALSKPGSLQTELQWFQL